MSDEMQTELQAAQARIEELEQSLRSVTNDRSVWRQQAEKAEARITELEGKCEEMGDLLTGYYASHHDGDPMRAGDVDRKRIAELETAINDVLDVSSIQVTGRDDAVDALRQWGQVATTQNGIIEQLTAQLQRAREALGNLISSLRGLIAESHGVTGLHLNGDVADWQWLEENEWLEALPAAEQALADLPAAVRERRLHDLKRYDKILHPSTKKTIIVQSVADNRDGTWCLYFKSIHGGQGCINGCPANAEFGIPAAEPTDTEVRCDTERLEWWMQHHNEISLQEQKGRWFAFDYGDGPEPYQRLVAEATTWRGVLDAAMASMAAKNNSLLSIYSRQRKFGFLRAAIDAMEVNHD
jgi:hypothetical protein